MRRCFFLLLLLTSCHKKEDRIPPPSYPIHSAIAEEKQVPLFIEALGHVDPITSIQIRSRVEGELIGVHFEEGKEIKKGDLLFTIDPRPYESARKASLATLEQNKASLVLAEEKVKRFRLLAQDEFYSQIDYETLQANYITALALVKQNEAELETANLNLDYCRIYAPIDGMSGLLEIDLGNLVLNGSDPLTSLNQMSPIYVTFSIPECDLPKIQRAKEKECLKVLAAYEDFSHEIFEGTLLMMNNAVDEKTGMITLRAIFANKNLELWPGQFIRSRLILETIQGVQIPFSAVQLTQKGPVVFVVKADQTIEERSVVLGQREDQNVLILKGVQAGEKVATDGLLNLAQGVHIYTAEDA